MAEPVSTLDDLSVVLQVLRLQHADGKSPFEVTQTAIELLLARIASLTDAVRGAPESSETFRVGARLLLADVAMVSAQFRGQTNAVGQRLTCALEDARLALAATTPTAEPEP